MMDNTEFRSYLAAAPVALASAGGILYWSVGFYLSNLFWLLLVSVPPAASRIALVYWENRLPSLVWTPIELAVSVFRLGLVVVIIGLARGTGEQIPGLPINWLPDVVTAAEYSLMNWPIVLWQLLVIGLIIVVVNMAITSAVVPRLAARIEEENAQAVALAFKNFIIIPLFTIYLYGIFIR